MSYTTLKMDSRLRGNDRCMSDGGASQLYDPHPKSLSLREMDFEIRLLFSLREKGLGDEGVKFAKDRMHPAYGSWLRP